MKIIQHRFIFFVISGLIVLTSLILIFTKGINVGIDFTGGTILEVAYTQEVVAEGEEAAPLPAATDIAERIEALEIGSALVQPTGERGFIIRTKDLTEPERVALMESIAYPGLTLEEARVNTIGPTIGKELKEKAWIAILTVVIAIVLFIAYVFRAVSEPVSSWKYGLIAIVALIHDIIIPTGLVALLGLEIDSLFVIALLAILGLSVNDTIVVFDRVRENLRNKISRDFAETVGKSLEQTFVRSINTSLTTLFVILSLYFFGPDTTKNFALVLAAGMIAGTYSSIFIASPLLVEVEKRS